MRIIIDILHPAHVHVFKHFTREMRARGHEVMFTARDKDRSVELLRLEGFEPKVLSRHKPGTFDLARELVGRTQKFLAVAKEFNPDVLTGIMGPTIAPAGRLMRTPSVVFYDTEFARVTNRWVYPMAKFVVTPNSYLDDIGKNQRRYDGYHELAYLHPNRFTPDPAKIESAGLSADEPYVFFRFVAFEASHDTGESGLTMRKRAELVHEIAKTYRVVISSEQPLPDDLQPYAFSGAVEDIHHVLAFAHLTLGESATMASESAVLGTPSVYIATSDRGYIREQQDRYGLVKIFRETESEEFLAYAREQLADPQLAEKAHAARERLLAENIDVTDFMVRFFEEQFGTA